MNRILALAITFATTAAYANGAVPVTKVTTGTQATVSIGWQRKNYVNNDNTYSADKVAKLTYKDKTGYFGKAPTINAWLGYNVATVEHGVGLVSSQPASHLIQMTLGKNGVYRGSLTQHLTAFDGDTDQDITNVRGAFTSGAKWDSNLGANYSLGAGATL